ncbi:MAG: histidine phosphatase family protein [Acidobacteria bacterium]|nr:histidine phosphatase family protein [Acidobacteriota bacterium]
MVHLIRHGRTTVTGVFVGSTDVELVSEDIRVSELAVARVLSSPLRRARRTAELLFPGRELELVPEWAGGDLGSWELKSWGEIVAECPAAETDWFGVRPPGGEFWGDFVERVAAGWRRAAPGDGCAIVAHAGVNAVLRQMLAGGDWAGMKQDYLEVISLAV